MDGALAVHHASPRVRVLTNGVLADPTVDTPHVIAGAVLADVVGRTDLSGAAIAGVAARNGIGLVAAGAPIASAPIATDGRNGATSTTRTTIASRPMTTRAGVTTITSVAARA